MRKSLKFRKMIVLSVVMFGVLGVCAHAQLISFGFWRPHFLFTWVGGTTQETLSGNYGTQGTASTANYPGVRFEPMTWVDSSGNFWLFGGDGFDGAGAQADLSDLWEYTPSNSQWNWVSGLVNAGQPGVYGTKGTGSTSNYPGGRDSAAFWIDSSGNLWLFGGEGYASGAGAWGYLNDLWEYTPSSSQWTWVSGASTIDSSGHYGTEGTGSTNNHPGGRTNTVGWNDGSGNFWIFGGWGLDSAGDLSELNDLWKYTVSNSRWTWISGASAVGAWGSYGTKGTGSTSNTPGARQQMAGWIDSSANLWVFGGYGYDSVGNSNSLNDFWKFTPSSTKWTWVSGSSLVNSDGTFGTQGAGSTSNIPSARDANTFFKDGSGNFWLFGGDGYDSVGNIGMLNDLWKYVPATSQWTWVAGSSTANPSGVYGTKGTGSTSNTPGARYQSAMWADPSGNPWILGGYGFNPAYSNGYQTELNDLWQYTPSNSKWTWVSGFSGNILQPTYGTLGTASASNIPSARYYSQNWVDPSGNLWLFGGYGLDGFNVSDWQCENDLWKYSTTTSQWTWMGGATTVGQSGIYGTLGTGSTSNIPGGRNQGMTWTDTSGNLWLFGGEGMDSTGVFSDINDLWKYNPTNSQWTWMAGSSLANQVPVYGTKGIGSTSNIPGARDSSASWTDASGNLWLFGGWALDSVSHAGEASDLWKFSPSTSKWTWVSGPDLSNQSGVYGTLGVGSTSNYPGGRADPYSWVDTSGNFWIFGGWGWDSQGNYNALNDLWKYAPSSSQWTWMGGSSTNGANGVYGTQGVASSSNIPGGRAQGIFWTDSSGNFWLMGGIAFDSAGNGPWVINDIWRYTPTTNQWTWMSGSSLDEAASVYNTVGVTFLSSIPGAGFQWTFWHDQRGFNWFFGGDAADDFGVVGPLNTLWKMSP
jgi:N-acetylneuraminic acid mutarotase